MREKRQQWDCMYIRELMAPHENLSVEICANDAAGSDLQFSAKWCEMSLGRKKKKLVVQEDNTRIQLVVSDQHLKLFVLSQ